MQYNNRSLWSSIMPVTKHLLVINTLVLLATMVLRMYLRIDLDLWLGLFYWRLDEFNPIQLFTHMFMHANFLHLFVNMFTLWMFGSLLERVLGSKRYLFYYISCGLGAALIQELVLTCIDMGVLGSAAGSIYSVTVGASGAVFGLLLAFAMIFPNMPMYIIPIPVPIKAKWMVLGYGLLELYFGVSGNMSDVAHYAHLGGMIAGIIIILYWKHNGTLTRGNGFY